ncbi:uncharacterized protein [Macaca nemestrina]|uniref:uncharacterized protein isoform X2 n=1 Tax=Macaca nemestrina TaxID=9545 RepID=UPI0039B99442
MPGVPLATDLRADPTNPSTDGHGAATWPAVRGARGFRSPGSRPGVRLPLPAATRRVNTRRSPPPCPGVGAPRSARADPHFCASCHAREKRRGGRRGGKTRQRSTETAGAGGVRACARRGGRPRRPADSRSRPAPAYLPGSLRRFAPPAPS